MNPVGLGVNSTSSDDVVREAGSVTARDSFATKAERGWPYPQESGDGSLGSTQSHRIHLSVLAIDGGQIGRQQ